MANFSSSLRVCPSLNATSILASPLVSMLVTVPCPKRWCRISLPTFNSSAEWITKLPLPAAGGGVGAAGRLGRIGVVLAEGVVLGGDAVLVDRGLASVIRLGFSCTGSSSQSSHRVRLRDGMGVELVLPMSRYSDAMSRKKRLMTHDLVWPLW